MTNLHFPVLPKLMSMFRSPKIRKPIQFIAIRSCSYFAVHHKAKKRGLFVSIFGYNLKRKVMENGNKPIHPIEDFNKDSFGLTKREYFAGLAMQGLCVNKKTSEIKQGECVDIAELSLIIADELLKQLEQ